MINLKQTFFSIFLIIGSFNNGVFASENTLRISATALEVELNSLVRNVFIGGAISSGLILYLLKETKGFSQLVGSDNKKVKKAGALLYTGTILAGIWGGLLLTGLATKNFKEFIYKNKIN